MAATAATLRVAAQVIENYWPEQQLDVVTAIRIAAGTGPDGYELSELALRTLADHLGYGHLNVWSDRHTTIHITAELRKAADATQERAR